MQTDRRRMQAMMQQRTNTMQTQHQQQQQSQPGKNTVLISDISTIIKTR
jgi:hypothetical protein